MRKISYPSDHWRMQTDIPFSMGVQENDLFFLCGQSDLQGKGIVQHAGDLLRQTEAAIQHIRTIVEDLDNQLSDIAKLVVYYIPDERVEQSRYLAHIAETLAVSPLPAITLVPLSNFFYPGLMVEIDAFGFDSKTGAVNHRLHIPTEGMDFSAAVRQGGVTITGAVMPFDHRGRVLYSDDAVRQSHLVFEKMSDLLKAMNASRQDIVKINNWFVGADNAEQWAETAKIRASWYPDPGPVATGMPLYTMMPNGATIQTECWVMQGLDNESLPRQHCWPGNHWNWPVYLPFKHGLRCGRMVFVGGQVSMDAAANVVDMGDMGKQAKASMENLNKVLAGLGADFADVIKMNSFYKGGSNPEELHANLDIRKSYFSLPGPASTGIPLDNLCYPGMMTEFEAIAVVAE